MMRHGKSGIKSVDDHDHDHPVDNIHQQNIFSTSSPPYPLLWILVCHSFSVKDKQTIIYFLKHNFKKIR